MVEVDARKLAQQLRREVVAVRKEDMETLARAAKFIEWAQERIVELEKERGSC